MDKKRCYQLSENCHLGEIDNYGYALVPGNSIGVVIFDLETKRLLENLQNKQNLDEFRIKLLLDKKIICSENEVVQRPLLDITKVRSVDTWIHLTNSCNLSCPYCYIINKGPYQHMPLSIIRAYLDKLEKTVKKHQLNSLSIRLSGGEPTLCKENIFFLVEEIKNRFAVKGIKTKLILLTNGTILDSNLLQFLALNSIGICISLDGIDEWHNLTRFFTNGKGSFDLVRENICACKKHGLSPTILTTIVENNINGIYPLSKFLIDENLLFRFSVFRDNVGDYPSYSGFIKRTLFILKQCYDYYASAIREGKSTFRHKFAGIHIDKKYHLRSCGIGYSGVAVNHFGNVFSCQANMHKKSIGNLWDENTLLEMAWSQKTFPELNGNTVFGYEGCENCKWALICGGGCSVINANARGAATKKSPYCELFKILIPIIVDLKVLSLISKFKIRRR